MRKNLSRTSALPLPVRLHGAARTAVLLLVMVLLVTGDRAAGAQPAVSPDKPAADAKSAPLILESSASFQIKPGQTLSLQLKAEPGSLQLVEVSLGGGLLNLQAPDLGRRLLDLGKGGRLRLALQIPANGATTLELASSERLRPATVQVRRLGIGGTEAEKLHLHEAGIAFARADSTRRRQPHAPDAATALSEYDRAAGEATAAGDTSLARWVLAQKARFLLYQKSSFVDTRALLLRAAALPGSDDAAAQALVYKTLSSCEYYLGDLPAAVADGERSLALYRQTGDLYWQGVVLGNLIPDYAELGRDADAASAAREALTDAEQTQDTAGVVFSLTELANLYHQQGELQSAFQAFREAQTWAEDIRYAPLIQAEIEEALGQFYLGLGLWPEAEEQLKRCLQHTPPESAAALQARGMLAHAAERRGDLRDAQREYDDALAVARRQHLPAEEAALLLGRSSMWLVSHRPADALADARGAAKLAREQDTAALRIEAALAEGAACRQSCADPAEAAAIYQQAIAWINASGKREQEALAYAGLARVHASTDHPELALNEVDHALTLLEHSRASLASHDLAANLFTQRRGWYGFATELALELDRTHPGQGFGAAAFRFTERARARAMLDALGQASPRAGSPADAALAVRLAANSHRIESQESELLTVAHPERTAATLRTLYREQDALEAEVRHQTGASSLDTPEIASVERIQQQLLKDGDALVAFAPGEHHVHRWLITSSTRRVDMLPSMEELETRFKPLQRALVSLRPEPRPGENVEAYEARLTRFRRDRDTALAHAGSLLLPALPERIHHLYVVAEGTLLALPWGALGVSCAGRPCYAVQRFSLSLEPSASVAIALGRHRTSAGGAGVLVVSSTLPVAASPDLHWAALSSLPGSEREARAIAQMTPLGHLHLLQGGQASVENVRTALGSDLALAHFAAHTVLIHSHPELSGIALSPHRDASSGSSGVLWLHEIPHLQSPPLVVLSGCATQGAGLAGEELSAMAQAFFYAGAQQVVATAWFVDDDATVVLMRDFYRNLLQRGMSPAEALRLAQIRRIHAHADVADWAPFLVDGVPAGALPMESAAR